MKIEDVKKVFCGEFRSVHDHNLFWNQFPIFLYFVDDPCVFSPLNYNTQITLHTYVCGC